MRKYVGYILVDSVRWYVVLQTTTGRPYDAKGLCFVNSCGLCGICFLPLQVQKLCQNSQVKQYYFPDANKTAQLPRSKLGNVIILKI